MKGVPANLDLTPFVGATLLEIGLGRYIIQFRFDTPEAHTIAVEGAWDLRDATGAVVDQDVEPATRESYRLHVLLGGAVIGTELDAPDSFGLRFDSGHILRVYDRSPEYEGFSIQPGDIIV